MQNQTAKILPRSEWQKIIINENNEELAEIKETLRLKIGLVKKQYEPSFFVRKTIAEKLIKVSQILPEGINLILIEGYRTLKSQQELWDKEFQKLRLKNSSWADERIEQYVRLVIARPAPLANHHCGGAIDVTLAYTNGALLDMGSPYPNDDTSAGWHNKFQMLSDEIDDEQEENRKILRDAMETQDFVWYPGEWWHYSWGDRMWAVYSNQTECFYGPAYFPFI